jgi:hypothetical protein
MQYQTLPNIPGHIQANHWSVIVPEARINLVPNPSFELNTTNWSATGTGVTITRDTAFSYFGGASGRMTDTAATGSSEFINSTAIAVTPGVTYTLSFRYRKTATARGTGAAGLFVRNSGGTTISQPSISLCRGNSGGWIYGELTFVPPTGAVDCQVFFSTDGATTGAFNLWIDGVQLEQGGYATTYIDGDQDGCYWTGSAHNSTSGRYSYTRSGGRIVNLRDFRFVVLASVGFGAPALNTVSADYALGGAQYQRSVITARNPSIVGAFQADGLLDLKRQKAALLNVLKPDAVSPQQPVRLVYQARDFDDNALGNPVYVDAVYTGGLEGNEANEHAEQAAIGFRVHLPWVGTSDGDISLGTGAYTYASRVVYKDKRTGAWIDTNHPGAAGTFGDYITSNLTEDPLRRRLFVADGAEVRMWTGTAWSTIGTAAGGAATVSAVLFAPDGNLYVAGDFTSVSSVSAANVAKWDGTSWTAMSTGVSTAGRGLTWTRGNVLLINAGETLRRWTGSAWSTILNIASASILNGAAPVLNLPVVVPNGDVWMGTNVDQLGGLDYKGFFRITWAQQVAGTWGIEVTPETLWSDKSLGLSVDKNGVLYATGSFTNIGGKGVLYAARIFSDTNVSPLQAGSPPDANTFTGAFVASDGTIYMGGSGDTKTFSDGRVFYSAGLYESSGFGQWKHGLITGITRGEQASPAIESTYGLVVVGYDWVEIPFRTTVTSVSSTATPITYKITGPGFMIGLVNYTTGRIIRFEGLEVLSGEVITIVTGPGASIISDRRGDLSTFLSPESNLYTFTIAPGTNELGTLYNNVPGGSISAYYRPRYDSIDQP